MTDISLSLSLSLSAEQHDRLADLQTVLAEVVPTDRKHDVSEALTALLEANAAELDASR